jgi:exopolysaccharide biosynthesis polyprenyl glycosylphosphotransferase
VNPERLAWETFARACVDLVALAACWVAAVYARAAVGAAIPDGVVGPFRLGPFDVSAHLALVALVAPAFLAILWARGDHRRFGSPPSSGWALGASVGIGLGAVALALFLLDVEWVSRPAVFGFAALAVPALAAARRARASLRRVRVQDRALVVGAGAAAAAFAEVSGAWGVRVVDVVAPTLLPDDPRALRDRVIAARAGEVVVVGDAPPQAALSRLAAACDELGVRLSLDASFLGVRFGSAELREVGPFGLVSFARGRATGLELALKRTIDVVGAALGLVVAAPALLALMLLVRRHDGGPAIYAQRRVGLHGRPFTLYKLRSMRVGADEQQPALAARNEVHGPAFKLRADPRVTPIGRFLRRSSLDELPQLVNVLRGDMSLVGPRPPLPAEVAAYEPWQVRRLSMRPGLTGLWQVSGRSDLPFDRWMRLDLAYIDRWSLGLDLVVLLRTVPAVLSGRGAW